MYFFILETTMRTSSSTPLARAMGDAAGAAGVATEMTRR
jgi:hypothetical protein